MASRTRKAIALALALVALAALLLAVAAGWNAARSHPAVWKQLRIGVEAFAGLVGVALIGLCAVVVLLVADAWMSRREKTGRDEGRDPP